MHKLNPKNNSGFPTGSNGPAVPAVPAVPADAPKDRAGLGRDGSVLIT